MEISKVLHTVCVSIIRVSIMSVAATLCVCDTHAIHNKNMADYSILTLLIVLENLIKT